MRGDIYQEALVLWLCRNNSSCKLWSLLLVVMTGVGIPTWTVNQFHDLKLWRACSLVHEKITFVHNYREMCVLIKTFLHGIQNKILLLYLAKLWWLCLSFVSEQLLICTCMYKVNGESAYDHSVVSALYQYLVLILTPVLHKSRAPGHQRLHQSVYTLSHCTYFVHFSPSYNYRMKSLGSE